MTFYFAWVDKNETTFDVSHHREDENIFSLKIEHSEGEFPSMVVDIQNPRVGFLAPSRKQWVWVSYDDGETVTPLFFGRIVGVPQSLQDELVRVTFVARPADYEQQKQSVADALRVLPYYDPVWFSEEQRRDPDAVLEGYSKVWHIDRISHVVTTSDVIVGEETGILFDDQMGVLYDSLEVAVGESPARRVVVDATVRWEQSAVGSVNITQDLLKAFKDQTPTNEIVTIDGMARSTEGMISVMCGESLIEQWPSPGDRVGSGWSVGNTRLDIVGGHPLPPIITDYGTRAHLTGWGDVGMANAIRGIFGRSPGLAVTVVDYTNPLVGENQLLWVPIYRMSASMNMDYDISRGRSERLQFEISADVQSVLSDPDDEETIYLNVGSADVDVMTDSELPIGSTRRNRYFDTDRGRQSFEHVLCRARSALLFRSRAIDIAFSIPFKYGVDLDCRRNGTLIESRLPGGQATGKIKQYQLIADGNTGEMSASVVLGCSVGKGGEPTPVQGDPVYADDYVNGYQIQLNSVVVPDVGDISYDDFTSYVISDDGVDLLNMTRHTTVLSATVTGGLVSELNSAQEENAAQSSVEVMDRIGSVTTTLRIEMVPLVGGPFDTTITPSVHDLFIPMMIDLEAE